MQKETIMSNDINIGAITEALNNKADLNLLNLNSQGRATGGGARCSKQSQCDFDPWR